MFQSSRGILFRWMAELNDRCFCYFTAAMLVPSAWAPAWRLHTKLYKFGWNTFPNNARMDYRTDLNLGEVVSISIIFHIPVFWINLLNGYDIYFWWGDTTNQPYEESKTNYLDSTQRRPCIWKEAKEEWTEHSGVSVRKTDFKTKGQ